MRPTHASTPSERVAWISYLLAHAGEYGVVTAMSRTAAVSWQTLYTWMARGRTALERAFLPPSAPPVASVAMERDILTLLVEGHASERQRCLAQVRHREVSLGTISAVVRDVQARALALVARQAPPGVRAVALNEMDGRDRQGAYLNIVDVESGAVWAAEGPVPVDGDTGTLALWLTHERGLRWHTTTSVGGAAMEQALRTVDPGGRAQRDVWHVLHHCGQVQGRLDRRVADLEGRTATVARQAARMAAGVRSHSFCALSHSSCATNPIVPAPSCTHPLVLCEKRPLHGTQRADRRTFCGILCRVAQILWDNPRTIYGM